MELDDDLDLDEKVDLDFDSVKLADLDDTIDTSKRVRMITSLIGNPYLSDILKILNLKGRLSYSEL